MLESVANTINIPVVAIISTIFFISIFVVIVICTCTEGGDPEPKTWVPRKPTVDQDLDQSASSNSNHVVVEIPGDVKSNGNVSSSSESHHRDINNSRISQATTLGRQLPDLPRDDKTLSAAGGPLIKKEGGPDDGYDHLRMPQNSPSRVNPGYDHCSQTTVAGDSKAIPKLDRENIYNLPSGESSDSGSGVVTKDAVREPIYELLTGETSDSGSGVVAGRENVYNEPGEQVVRKLAVAVQNTAPGAPIRDEEYTVVKELDVDPYAHISTAKPRPQKGDKPEHDPYAVINIDRNSFLENEARKSAGEKYDNEIVRTEDDEYATVAKGPRANGAGEEDYSVPGSPQAPPLPGRQYTDEDLESLMERDTAPMDAAGVNVLVVTEENGINGHDADKPACEVSYTEVTARESLASVQARQKERLVSQVIRHSKHDSRQDYETVIENYYSTVDGNSGDGCVVPRKLSVDVANARRNSDLSETYAEIHASGDSLRSDGVARESVEGMVYHGAATAPPPAPPPPSTNDQLYAVVNKKSLATVSEAAVSETRPRPVNLNNRRVVKSTPAPLASAECDDLLTEYFGRKITGNVADPNYESLDELRHVEEERLGVTRLGERQREEGVKNGARGERRVKSLGHEYEEVSGGKSRAESAYDVKKRVLQNHVYEVVVEPGQDRV